MTQERKDGLYDAMIAWICEHIQNDTELFNVLHEKEAGFDPGLEEQTMSF